MLKETFERIQTTHPKAAEPNFFFREGRNIYASINYPYNTLYDSDGVV